VTGARRQTRLLARTFFSRLFETDLMPAGMPQEQVVISVIAFIAGPSMLLPLYLMKKYLGQAGPPLQVAMAQDRTMAILLTMTVTAFISLVIWENLFPDRRDSRALGVLPIQTRAFVLARLLAIVGLFALVFLLTTAMSSLAFGVLGAMTGVPGGFAGVAAAHFLAVAAAQAFIFFGVVSVQCALLSVAGPVAAHRLSVALQMAIIILVLQMPLVLPPGTAYALDGSGAPMWAQGTSAVLLPPLWFLALYESLIGSGYAGAAHLSRTAGLLGLLTPVLALALYAASYGRLTRLAIEGRPAPPRAKTPLVSRLIGGLSARLTGTPEGAAVCAFTLRTVVRSRQHRMVLAVWVGVAVALTISAALPGLVRFGWGALDRPREALLVGPLILAALVQTGMRSLFAIPVEIRANWAIRLSEPTRVSRALSGPAAALVVAGVLPAALLAWLTGTWLWGARIGVMHATYSGIAALILVQVLMRGLDKIPFTCTYSPGKARIGKLWPLYLTLFSSFTYTTANLEAELLRRPRAFVTGLILMAGVAGLLWVLRLRRSRELPGLCYEAEPDDAMTVVSVRA
jgi:hypothetical protein